MTVPDGPADIATFDVSNTTNVSISASTEVNGIVFTSAATNPYFITASPELTLTISDLGIVNNSGMKQNFVTAVDETGNIGQIVFTNSAIAGNSIFTNNGSLANFVQGAETDFFNTSSAANGTFVNRGGTGVGTEGGRTMFYDFSTARNANFTNKSGVGVGTSVTSFYDSSTAANGTFTNEGGDTGGTFAEGGQTIFNEASTAGNGIFTNNGATASGGIGGATVFDDSSSAGNGNFTNNSGAASGKAALGGGNTIFLRTSTSSNGTFINNSADTSDGEGGVTEFGILPDDSPSAGNGTFINNGATISGAVGGKTVFYEASTAESATLIANGGTNGGDGGAIVFEENSTGGTARVEVFGNGILDLRGHNSTGVTIGSIESGIINDSFPEVLLGFNNLTIGSNNLSTTFSGLIDDGGFGGSLTKIGNGMLVLNGKNTYSGGTAIKGGKLVINNTTGSVTGSGPVEVSAGQLGGGGIIGGDVTVGDGSRRPATLFPGQSVNRCDTLTMQSTLTFQSDGIYKFDLDTRTATSDVVVANGVTIDSAALFDFSSVGHRRLPIGTIFIVIDNISANPITGTFSNLPDQSTFIINGNEYQVSYQGGDGNDLTLTVVP